jgi:hypothetical protein
MITILKRFINKNVKEIVWTIEGSIEIEWDALW